MKCFGKAGHLIHNCSNKNNDTTNGIIENSSAEPIISGPSEAAPSEAEATAETAPTGEEECAAGNFKVPLKRKNLDKSSERKLQ